MPVDSFREVCHADLVTFMDEFRAGRASAEEIDDWIDTWHMALGFGPPLHTHLGMTWEQYKRWGETGHLPQEDDGSAC